jgi:hypothetical protein
MSGAQNHYGTGQPLTVAPSVVLRIMSDLETGASDPEAVELYRAMLHRNPEQAGVAVGVLVRVCSIRECHACEVIGYPECIDCTPAIRRSAREAEAVAEFEILVRDSLRRIRSMQLRAEFRRRWPR